MVHLLILLHKIIGRSSERKMGLGRRLSALTRSERLDQGLD
jgi:hypothetical protein